MRRLLAYSGLVLSVSAGLTHASTFTTTSPNNGALPSNLSPVGGIVLDLTGLSGARVTSELAASSLFVGFESTGTPVRFQGNPLTIGIQSGFTPSVVAALGGGLASASVRISLYDGDTGIGDGSNASGSGGNDFDAFMDTLLINGNPVGASSGDFSAVTTQNTDSTGNAASAGAGLGFRNDLLDTGFFTASPAQLASLYSAVSGGSISFQLNDLSPGDNYFDFTQGIDASEINVGSGPVVTPPIGGGGGGTTVPEPASLGLLGAAFAAFGLIRRPRGNRCSWMA